MNNKSIGTRMLLVLLAGALGSGVAHAVPISHTMTFTNIDWCSSAISGVGGGSGPIGINCIGGPVSRAFLYWHGIDNGGLGQVYDNPNVTINGNPVVGAALGDATTNCWGNGSSRAFRADVTAFVPGNGVYNIAGMSALANHNANGASLVVIFNDGNAANNRDLAMFEGNDSNLIAGFPGENDGWHAVLTPINYGLGPALAQLHAADGQQFTGNGLDDNSLTFMTVNGMVTIPDALGRWEGASVPSAGTSRAGNGRLWDVHNFSITGAFGGVGGPVTLNVDGMSITIDCLGLVLMLLDLDPFTAPTFCEDPAPLTQGYWHRQCLGVSEEDGGIDPGRNGRGPQSPTEPDFDKLMPGVSMVLENLLAEFGGSCQGGMDADPPSDPCEKAVKQFTALVFNVVSGRLENSCEVDLADLGCDAMTLGDLLPELVALINSGDPDQCKIAADCAGAVNEGNVGGNGLGYTEEKPVVTDMPYDPGPLTQDGRIVSEGSSVAPVPEEAAPVADAPAPVEAEVTAAPLILVQGAPLETPVVPEAEAEEEIEADSDDPVATIRKHLAILAHPSASDKAIAVATGTLFEALGGGYELDLRLMMVDALIDTVDASLHSLLEKHLVDIRDAALELGQPELAKEAETLLKRVQK